MIPAPVILPLRYDIVGTRLNIDQDTYIVIKCDNPCARIYFTVDGTKPDPFQVGTTGRSSTIQYKGPFRLHIGNRVIKAVAVSRCKMRESPVCTKYINVIHDFAICEDCYHEESFCYFNDRPCTCCC